MGLRRTPAGRTAIVGMSSVALTSLMAGCGTDLPVETEESLLIEQSSVARWPAVLGLEETDTLRVQIVDGSGQPTEGLRVTWSTDSPHSLRIVTPVDSTHLAYVTGLAVDTTRIVVALEGDRVQAERLEQTISVEPLRVTSAQGWTDSIRVAELSIVSVQVTSPNGSAVTTGGGAGARCS